MKQFEIIPVYQEPKFIDGPINDNPKIIEVRIERRFNKPDNAHYYATSPKGKNYSVLDSKMLMSAIPFDEHTAKVFDYWEAILIEKGDLITSVILRGKDKFELAKKIVEAD